jgi:hypothetical protein
MLLQLEAPPEELLQLKCLLLDIFPGKAIGDASPLPVLELPAAAAGLLRSNSGCSSKWTDASDTLWLPALELPDCEISLEGSSFGGGSPRAAGHGAAASPSHGQAKAVVLELPPASGATLLRNDTGCSKWSRASEELWQPVLDLPTGSWSAGGSPPPGSSAASGSPRAAEWAAPGSPTGSMGLGEHVAADSEEACQQPADPQLAAHVLPAAESAPAALLSGSSSSPLQSPMLSARLGSAPAGGLRSSQLRSHPAAGPVQDQGTPRASVQLRKSGQLLRRQGSREMLRLLAHAYSELVGSAEGCSDAAAACRLIPPTA